MSENLDVFATRGIVIHINSDHYNKLKRLTNINTARQTIKKITAHNDKLMVDWAVLKKAFVLDEKGLQFKNSAYKQFLTQASTFLKDSKYNDYAVLLSNYAKTAFTKEPLGSRGGDVMEIGPQALQIGYENPTAERTVGAYKQEIEELRKQLEQMQSRYDE